MTWPRGALSLFCGISVIATAAVALADISPGDAATPAVPSQVTPAPTNREARSGDVVTLIEEGGLIEASATKGADTAVQRSFRLSARGATPLQLNFQANDLRSASGAVIDRRNIRVIEAKPLGPQPQDFVLEIAGFKRSGDYLGTLDVITPDGRRQALPVMLRVARSAPVTIDPQTPGFAVKRMESCDRVTGWLPLGSLCQDKYEVALTGDSEALKAASPSLLLVRPDGSVTTAGEPMISQPKAGRILLDLARADLPPGQYKGRVRVAFGDRADDIDIPLVIDSKWQPWLPLLALLIGILLGRWQAYMTRVGNQLAACADRLYLIRARRFPSSMDAVNDAIDFAAQVIDERLLAAEGTVAAAKIATLEACLDLADRINALDPDHFPPAAKDALTRFATAIRKLDLEEAKTAAAAVEAIAAPPAGGAEPAAPGAWLAYQSSALVDGIRRIGTLFTLTASRAVLYFILLALLVMTGMKLLYLDGSASLGANPIADFLSLLAWGLSADVASRTIANAAAAGRS